MQVRGLNLPDFVDALLGPNLGTGLVAMIYFAAKKRRVPVASRASVFLARPSSAAAAERRLSV